MSGLHDSPTTVDFFTKFTASETFDKVFKEGMGLVEETANYLDGPGRQDARLLDRHGAIAYATESMRLTTRLMQLASWLLLQRAIAAGEMTTEEARKEKHRISLSDIGRGNALTGSEQLPEALKHLVDRSLRLHMRVQKLDAMLNVQSKSAEAAASPVSLQLDRLASALKIARG
jgi:regulator of CtrA degradation